MADYQRDNYNAADIDACVEILREILWENHGKGLRLAQVIGNLGDNYYMEDPEYLQHIAKHSRELCELREAEKERKQSRTL